MKLRKTQLAAAVGAALLVGGTAVQAQPAPVVARDVLQVQLYGQVGRVLMWADDGHRSRWFHADNEVDGTRFGVRGGTQVMPGLRAGFRFEWEIQSNSSDSVSFDTPTNLAGPGGSAVGERFQEVILEGAWGRLNIGQGEAGADNAATRDLSNTKNSVCACDYGGAIAWRTSAGGFVGTTVGSTHSQQDFESRYDRLMYTTPSFGGFYAQVSTGQKSNTGEANEASLWFKGKMAGDLEAAIGWSEEKTGAAPNIPHNETIGGSISWLHTSGLNLTFGYTQQEFSVAPPRDKGKWTWGKVGYKFGPHAVAIDYGIAEDQAANGDEGDVVGLGYTWTPVRWLDIFAVYQLFTLDRPGVNVEDIQVGVIGAVVRF